jgi:hypothetical protein
MADPDPTPPPPPTKSKCKLPTISFGPFELPSFSLKLPSLPDLNLSLNLYCPLN